jgi:hypothetical protein
LSFRGPRTRLGITIPADGNVRVRVRVFAVSTEAALEVCIDRMAATYHACSVSARDYKPNVTDSFGSPTRNSGGVGFARKGLTAARAIDGTQLVVM